MRSFQIKVNVRAIVSNAQLLEFGLIENDLFVLRKRATDIVLHLFRSCMHVLKFWEDISSWLSHHFKYNIILKLLNILNHIKNLFIRFCSF